MKKIIFTAVSLMAGIFTGCSSENVRDVDEQHVTGKMESQTEEMTVGEPATTAPITGGETQESGAVKIPTPGSTGTTGTDHASSGTITPPSTSTAAPALEKAEKILAEAERQDTELGKEIDKEMSQSGMNHKSWEIYQMWDKALNDIWKIIENNLPKDQMEQVRSEEREWITYKEEEIEKAPDIENVRGGSMEPLVKNGRAAELTRIRCYELADLLR